MSSKLVYTENDLIAAVRKHATANYENGWDTVCECFADSDIAKMVDGAKTPAGAIKKVRYHVWTHNAYRDDIRAS